MYTLSIIEIFDFISKQASESTLNKSLLYVTHVHSQIEPVFRSGKKMKYLIALKSVHVRVHVYYEIRPYFTNKPYFYKVNNCILNGFYGIKRLMLRVCVYKRVFQL